MKTEFIKDTLKASLMLIITWAVSFLVLGVFGGCDQIEVQKKVIEIPEIVLGERVEIPQIVKGATFQVIDIDTIKNLIMWHSEETDTLTIRWDANQEPDLLGYSIKFTNEYGEVIEAGPFSGENYKINLERGTWEIFIFAHDKAGNKSGPSKRIKIIL